MKLFQWSLLAVLLTTLLMTVAGCTKKPGDRLIGKWQGSTKLGSVGPGVEAQFVGAAMGRIHMTAEFRSDGTMRSSVTNLNCSWKSWESLLSPPKGYGKT